LSEARTALELGPTVLIQPRRTFEQRGQVVGGSGEGAGQDLEQGMNVLCWVGIHWWKKVGAVSGQQGALLPVGLKECRWCGCGEAQDFDCVWTYSPRQMLIAKHGTLAQFSEAVNKASDHLFCTTEEADMAIEKYRQELRAAKP
jgi:hypothetical protein